jgi:class 3 adenylate cyclase
MNEIPVAHVRVQGINFVFIPLSQGMTRLTPSEQQSVVSELTKICRSANLAGSIVPAWPTISGVGFSCEPNVRSLLSQSLKLDFVLGNVNKKLKAPISAVLNKALFNNDGMENEGKTSDPHRGGLSLNNNNVQKNSSIKNDCPNKLLTMLFSDIVGSTKIKQQFGDSKAVSIIEDHHSIVRELLLVTTSGQEVSTSGDSFFIVFETPSEAVIFALKWQDRIRDFAYSHGLDLSDRIGIHVGEVYSSKTTVPGKDIDYNGIQVDTTARLMSLAQGNQILLSQCAFENAKQMLEGVQIPGVDMISWKSYGRYSIKGVNSPIEVFEVGETGAALLKQPPDSDKAYRVD